MPIQQNASMRDYDERAKQMLVVALDTQTVDEAQKLVDQINGAAGVYKVGLELLFGAGGGLEFAKRLKTAKEHVFLDMKLHDIGNTVQKAVTNIAELGFEFLTVHGRNRKILRAAVDGRSRASGGSSLKLLAVTVLTDSNQNDLLEEGIEGQTALELVLQRAQMARDEGFNGVIASGREAKAIREMIPDDDFIIKVPGIRPAGAAAGDQVRTMTPGEAIRDGASYIVVGRPIYQAADPERAAKNIIREIAEALKQRELQRN